MQTNAAAYGWDKFAACYDEYKLNGVRARFSLLNADQASLIGKNFVTRVAWDRTGVADPSKGPVGYESYKETLDTLGSTAHTINTYIYASGGERMNFLPMNQTPVKVEDVNAQYFDPTFLGQFDFTPYSSNTEVTHIVYKLDFMLDITLRGIHKQVNAP